MRPQTRRTNRDPLVPPHVKSEVDREAVDVPLDFEQRCGCRCTGRACARGGRRPRGEAQVVYAKGPVRHVGGRQRSSQSLGRSKLDTIDNAPVHPSNDDLMRPLLDVPDVRHRAGEVELHLRMRDDPCCSATRPCCTKSRGHTGHTSSLARCSLCLLLPPSRAAGRDALRSKTCTLPFLVPANTVSCAHRCHPPTSASRARQVRPTGPSWRDKDDRRTPSRSRAKTVPSPRFPPVTYASIWPAREGSLHTRTFLSQPVPLGSSASFASRATGEKGRGASDAPSASREGEMAEVQREVLRGESVTELAGEEREG